MSTGHERHSWVCRWYSKHVLKYHFLLPPGWHLLPNTHSVATGRKSSEVHEWPSPWRMHAHAHSHLGLVDASRCVSVPLNEATVLGQSAHTLYSFVFVLFYKKRNFLMKGEHTAGAFRVTLPVLFWISELVGKLRSYSRSLVARYVSTNYWRRQFRDVVSWRHCWDWTLLALVRTSLQGTIWKIITIEIPVIHHCSFKSNKQTNKHSNQKNPTIFFGGRSVHLENVYPSFFHIQIWHLVLKKLSHRSPPRVDLKIHTVWCRCNVAPVVLWFAARNTHYKYKDLLQIRYTAAEIPQTALWISDCRYHDIVQVYDDTLHGNCR